MRGRILQWLASVVWRLPWVIIAASLVLAIVAGLFAARTMKLNANTDDLIAPDRPFMANYRRFLDEFGDLEYIYAIVEHPSGAEPATTEAIVDELTKRLRRIPNLPGVYSGIEPGEQLRLAAFAMPESELEGLVKASGALPALMQPNAKTSLTLATQNLQALIRGGRGLPAEEQERLAAGAMLLLNIAAAVRESSPSRAQVASLIAPDLSREYFKSESGRYYFISIIPHKDYQTLALIEEPLRLIRDVIDAMRRDYPDTTFGLTGKPVLQADEMSTTNADMTLAASIAMVLCAALFMLSFGGFWKPLMAVIAFGCGGAWTYGYATLAIGQLNLLSIVFMLVLVGVGLDYGIHVLTRFREARREFGLRESISMAVVRAGRGNITGALTSATVFFMALFTTFQGLRELGVIAGGGLLLCVAAMTMTLPAMLVVFHRRGENLNQGLSDPSIAAQRHSTWHKAYHAPSNLMHAGIEYLTSRPGPVLIALALLTFALVFAPGDRRFEDNLLKLQAEDLESVQWERRILDDSAAASWFGAVITGDQQHALRVIEQARDQPNIGAVNSVFSMVPPQSPFRARLREQWSALATEATRHPATTSEGDISADDLRRPAQLLATIAGGAAREAPEEAARFRQVSEDLQALAADMARSQPVASAIRARLAFNFSSASQTMLDMLAGNQLTLREALPAAIRERFISHIGNYLIMLHPRENVWDYDAMGRFISDMREVDPEVTGAPIAHYESLAEMRWSFIQMSLLALVVIAVIVLLDFRSVKLTVLALIPTIIGLIWLIEAMALLDISFNLANFFSVPILIGLSVDGSVHVLHRYKEGGPERLRLGATRSAVIVTALTTTIGFGALVLAHHNGLRSLGQVMALGSVFCMIASILVLPALLTLLERRGALRA